MIVLNELGVDPNLSEPTWNSSHTALQYFNMAAFAQNTPGVWGNVPKGYLRGPGFWNFDTRFAKQFSLTESHKLTFQWDAFNAFNHTNFADPAADINSPATFGQITSQANANRVMQFALRYDF